MTTVGPFEDLSDATCKVLVKGCCKVHPRA
jgi:hypothetical protein